MRDLTRVLAHYELGKLATVRKVDRGFVNETWCLETDQGRYILKRRHPTLRDLEIIQAQQALIAYLRCGRFPAPAIVPTIDGETFLPLEDEVYGIEVYIAGVLYIHANTAHFFQAALTLGRYHAVAWGFESAPLHTPGKFYSPTSLLDHLQALTGAWELPRDTTLAQPTRRLQAHVADLADNRLFDEKGADRIVGVVDYDKAHWEPRVAGTVLALGLPRYLGMGTA